MLSGYIKKTGLPLLFLFVYFVLLLLNAIGYTSWLPSCPILEITNHECLGCGLNRAAIALIRGDFAEAYVSNPLIYIYIPLIAGLFFYNGLKHFTNNKNTSL